MSVRTVLRRVQILWCISILAAAGLTDGTAAADIRPASHGATEAPAHYPDWSGVWVIPETRFVVALFADTNPSNPQAPKLSAANLAKLNAYNARRMTGQEQPGFAKLRTNTEMCLPAGMPATMSDPIALEFLFTPGQVTVISEAPSVRRIYTDGRTRPSNEPSFNGTSIGHWEGDTLVVETANINAQSQLLAVVRTSGQARVTERIHRKDAKHLQIDTVVEDPIALQAPWRYTRTYDLLENSGMREYYCAENNRDPNGGEPDLTPPK